MAKFFNQFLFYMVKLKLKIKWKPVKQKSLSYNTQLSPATSVPV